MIKKTNAKPRPQGGVVKDPNVRVKVKTLAIGTNANIRPSEIELPSKRGVRRISKLNPKGMRSIIGDSAEDIQQLLESGDNDSAVAMIYKKMLQATVDLLPHAEHAVRKSKGARGVYQVNSLVSSIRELLVDIQSAQDRGLLGEMLVEKILRPAFMDIGMMVAREYAQLADDSKQYMTVEDHSKWRADLKESRGRVADKIMTEYKSVQESTRDYLQR